MRPTSLALLLCVLWTTPAVGAPARTLASLKTARITADQAGRTWAVGNELITLSVELDQDSSLWCRSLVLSSTGRAIELGGGAGLDLTLNGFTLAFGSKKEGWTFVDAPTVVGESSVRIGFIFDQSRYKARVTRWFSVSAGTPTIETWTVIESSQGALRLDGLNLWDVVMPAGDVSWISGLQATENSEPFTRHRTPLGQGDRLLLGADGRSSEYTVPWFAVHQGADLVYGGLLWSGAWGATFTRSEDDLLVRVGLPATVTTIEAGKPLETPHFFFGASAGTDAALGGGLRAFLRDTLRLGRAWDPLVTYNTWFAYGTRVDDKVVRDELTRNAALGTELFVLDAGWYPGWSEDPADFTPGLGRWDVDKDRFPNGLGPLVDQAHRLGMKFGVWVEPERLDLNVAAETEFPERWLATRDGRYDPNRAPEQTNYGQVCLASAQARAWLLDRLTTFIETHHPDYLKWDNNFWLNCNRAGHDHGDHDGNFRHVQGLYALLGELRERFPELAIENVSGGGNRLDFGMLRYTDAAWMDDRSAPSVHVRHNIEGLSSVFPPAYLLSFVMGHEDEPMNDARDLSLYVRSRMPGRLGLCFRSADLSPAASSALTSEIKLYKNLRTVLNDATAALLTPQVSGWGGGDWDAIQATSAESARAVVFAFQQNSEIERVDLYPVQLDPEATYDIASVDDGRMGTATGAQLMESGIGLRGVARSAAHIVTLTPVGGGSARKTRK